MMVGLCGRLSPVGSLAGAARLLNDSAGAPIAHLPDSAYSKTFPFECLGSLSIAATTF